MTYNLVFGQGIYRDTGCELAPSCLNCPLPQCKYDTPGRQQLAGKRHERAQSLRDRGYRPAAIAETLGVSRRTVFRLLQEAS